MSSYVIYDPARGEWLSGDNYSVAAYSTSLQSSGIQPLDAGSGGSAPTTGFYRVVRDGVHICGLTNGMTLSGDLQFPIEFALGDTDQITGVTFYNAIDGTPVIGAVANPLPSGGWMVDWNTLMTDNGGYQLYAEIDFANDPPISSPTNDITVNNVISFNNYFSRLFGDRMWLYAETVPNAAFEIDMFDENTNYVGYFSGNADGNGVISFLWDLTAGTNDYRADTNFYGTFYVDTSGSSPVQQTLNATNAPVFKELSHGAHPNWPWSAHAPQSWGHEPAWQVGNGWCVAWSPPTIQEGYLPKLDNAMMLGQASGNIGPIPNLLGFGATLSGGNSTTSAFELQNETTKQYFLDQMALPGFRHLFFLGHANVNCFGTEGTNGAIIQATEVVSHLHNYLYLYKIDCFHPYRLVVMIGCYSARGKLCEAFGIPAYTLDNSYFANLHIQSRAYVGFTRKIQPFAENNDMVSRESLCYAGFINDWFANLTIQTCCQDAVGGYNSGYNMPSCWEIYGAVDLQRTTDTTTSP